MKEYKRCKYCSMEMDKSAMKCPHCNKIQASRFSIDGKSENFVVILLIIVTIIVGISPKISNIQDSIGSFTSFFDTSEFLQNASNELQNITAFFDDLDDDRDYSYIEASVEDIIYDFEDDQDDAVSYYSDESLELSGEIKKIETDSNGAYVYLNTYGSRYSICICIPASNKDDVNYVSSLETGDYITFMGDFYYDESSEYDIYIKNGYVV